MLEIKTYVLTPFLLEGLTVLGMTVVGRPLFIPYRRSRKRSSVHLSLTFSNLFFLFARTYSSLPQNYMFVWK